MIAVDPQLSSAVSSVIKGRRAQLALSQEELADRSGWHRTYIADVERGARNVSLKTLDRLATGLGLSLGDLVNQIDTARAGQDDWHH